MSVDFYVKLFALSPMEQRYLEFLAEEDEDLQKTIADSVTVWRNDLRKRYPEPLACRRVFIEGLLSRTAAKFRSIDEMRAGAAFVLFLSDEVERRVQQMDNEEKREINWN